jgi:hypothetical protein
MQLNKSGIAILIENYSLITNNILFSMLPLNIFVENPLFIVNLLVMHNISFFSYFCKN